MKLNVNSKLGLIRMAFAAMCLALCLVLPLITGGIPYIGNVLSPMHIPVLLCGFLCGPVWGAAVGLVAPLLRSLIFSAPPMMIAVSMSAELMFYGLAAALLYKAFPKKNGYIYASLIGAMIIGRIAGIASKYVLFGLGYIKSAALLPLLESYFVTSWPGMLIHIALIPAVIFALRRAGLFPLNSMALGHGKKDKTLSEAKE